MHITNLFKSNPSNFELLNYDHSKDIRKRNKMEAIFPIEIHDSGIYQSFGKKMVLRDTINQMICSKQNLEQNSVHQAFCSICQSSKPQLFLAPNLPTRFVPQKHHMRKFELKTKWLPTAILYKCQKSIKLRCP